MPGFNEPIHLEARSPTVRLPQPAYCSCPNAFCAGPQSADWLHCTSTCKACHPPPPRQRMTGDARRRVAEGEVDQGGDRGQ